MWHLSIQLIIVCVYIALLFGISFYVKRRADKGSTEYLFAGRKLSAGLIAVNITGLAVGAASTVGVAENAFKVGMAAGCGGCRDGACCRWETAGDEDFYDPGIF